MQFLRSTLENNSTITPSTDDDDYNNDVFNTGLSNIALATITGGSIATLGFTLYQLYNNWNSGLVAPDFGE